MTEMISQREAFGDALVELGAVNERVVVIDADLASSTKVDKFAAAYPERFFQVGVAEQIHQRWPAVVAGGDHRPAQRRG